MAAKPNKKLTPTKSKAKKRAPRDSFLAVHYRQAKASFSDLWKRPIGNVLTIAVISMALAMPACLYMLTKNVASLASDVATPSQISVYLKEATPEARIMVLKDHLESLPSVASVHYISSQQGLDELSQASGFRQAISLLDDYSLPSVLVILPKNLEKNDVKSLADNIKIEGDVTDVRLDEDWLSRLDALKRVASIVVISLSMLMFLAVFLTVGNTLRYNVLANKHEIQTMKLIGATDGFILRPYLYSGMWYGFIGAMVAWVMTLALTVLLNDAVTQLALLYDSQYHLTGLHWDEVLLLLMIGILLGSVAAKVSAQCHLKEIEPV